MHFLTYGVVPMGDYSKECIFFIKNCLGIIIIWASVRENMNLLHVNNKGIDQPAHLRSLISMIVIHSLESAIAKHAKCKISRF